MAIILPHIEDLNRTTYLPPQSDYETFTDDEHYALKLKEWGLSSAKGQFWYKEKDHQRLVSIKGYQVYGETDDFNTIIIEFQDGSLSCIHPAYLKEMQSSGFGKNSITNITIKTPVEDKTLEKEKETSKPIAKTPPASPNKTKKKDTKEKTPKIDLPEEKVHFTAKVKQFGLTWNHFNEDNDEVVVLENVIIQQDPPLKVGLAWCAHSKTLKKQELTPGETIEFDGKIVKKKLAKGKDIEDEAFIVNEPVSYKVNNPSKIKKS
ncbi:hypothetical protein [Mesobacillus maritimus]|uniref:hypothetical protein n=1 Tax=Mesobacillus maritimus TaxID=1643336 RepID=UPI003850E98A